MKTRRGFTLIELIVMLIILGILAAVFIPKTTTTYGVVRLEAACQKVALDLRYVQQRAMTEQVRFGIAFVPGQEAYFAYRVNKSTKISDPHTQNDLDIDFDDTSEFKGVEIVGTDFSGNTIEFDYIGAPYGGNGFLLSSEGIVTLQTADEVYSKTVRIEPVTGKVSIQ